MELTLTATGRRCDLSLHPVSAKTVERINALGPKFYTKKYIHWWRNGNTSTCGMKYDDECAVKVTLDGAETPYDCSAIPSSAVLLRRRHYLESKARYLALLGYDDEYCHMTWTWRGVEQFDPAKFDFFVHRWDRILGTQDFLILDDVRYAGAFADEQDWGGSCGFSLVDPKVIDLDDVRRELGIAAPERPMKPAASAVQPVTPCNGESSPLVLPVANPNGIGVHGCTTCKNSIQVDLRITDNVIQEAGGMAAGCDYSKECLTALAKMITGKTVYECYALSNEDIRPLLSKVHTKLDCDTFTVGALKIALRDWEKRTAA